MYIHWVTIKFKWTHDHFSFTTCSDFGTSICIESLRDRTNNHSAFHDKNPPLHLRGRVDLKLSCPAPRLGGSFFRRFLLACYLDAVQGFPGGVDLVCHEHLDPPGPYYGMRSTPQCSDRHQHSAHGRSTHSCSRFEGRSTQPSSPDH